MPIGAVRRLLIRIPTTDGRTVSLECLCRSLGPAIPSIAGFSYCPFEHTRSVENESGLEAVEKLPVPDLA